MDSGCCRSDRLDTKRLLKASDSADVVDEDAERLAFIKALDVGDTDGKRVQEWLLMKGFRLEMSVEEESKATHALVRPSIEVKSS